MIGQGPQDSGYNPVILRATAAGTWLFGVLAAVFAVALGRGFAGASSTGGRIGVTVFMGSCIVLSAWAAIFLLTHRSRLEISADAITYAKATSKKSPGGGGMLTLDRSSGDELRLVTATNRQGRKVITGMTVPGSGMVLPVATFGVGKVRKTCIDKGWRFP